MTFTSTLTITKTADTPADLNLVATLPKLADILTEEDRAVHEPVLPLTATVEVDSDSQIRMVTTFASEADFNANQANASVQKIKGVRATYYTTNSLNAVFTSSTS